MHRVPHVLPAIRVAAIRLDLLLMFVGHAPANFTHMDIEKNAMNWRFE